MSVPKISIKRAERELFEDTQLTLIEPLSTPHRITCRACERVGNQVESGILLCRECGSDIEATRAHIKATVAAHHARIDETWGALEQAVEGADETLQTRWMSFQDAITYAKPEVKQAEAKARAGMPGPLADLIRLWLAYKDALGVYTERQRWADNANMQIAFYLDEVL